MAPANVISVNPSKIAEGARFPEVVRQNVAKASHVRHVRIAIPSAGPLISFFFPTRRSGLLFSILLFIARMLLGTALLFPRLTGISFPSAEPLLPAIAFTLGCLIIIGILTRPMAILNAFYFGFALLGTSVSASSAGMAAILSLSLLIAVAGPGRISSDGIIRYIISRSEARRLKPAVPTYKAFSDRI